MPLNKGGNLLPAREYKQLGEQLELRTVGVKQMWSKQLYFGALLMKHKRKIQIHHVR
jgi:hypothetical protein